MKLSVLLGGLHNPNPATRLDVVRVLGMLDETRALEPLRECYPNETDDSVRQAIAWAGKRLFQAYQAGYSTVDEIFQYFGIDREIENTPDEDEARLMQQMDYSLQRDLVDMREKGARGKVGWAIGVGAVAGVGAGLHAMMMQGAESASSAMADRPRIGTTRTPATAPTDADISIWLRRLHESDQEGTREQAIIQLTELNNPRALPHLAATFINDPSPQIRQAAQRFGKILYWRAVYWTMEQDGSMAAEIQRRATALGKKIKADKTGTTPDTIPQLGAGPGAQPPTPSGSPAVDVADILMKAKEGRAKRKSKQRPSSRKRKQ
ncbi:MAG: HEAT repeat domain-containing protein [Anaerolineae bacterium]|nr:HEAT repeat domain-containing protein [Anaerolineae bacterium]